MPDYLSVARSGKISKLPAAVPWLPVRCDFDWREEVPRLPVSKEFPYSTRAFHLKDLPCIADPGAHRQTPRLLAYCEASASSMIQQEQAGAQAAAAPAATAEAATPQQQQPQQQHTASAADMEVDQDKAAKAPSRARSSSSSTSSRQPSRGQLKRTLQDLREDLDWQHEELGALKQQLIWSMSQNIRRERKEASQQVVLQGFLPRQEPQELEMAINQRERFVADLCRKLIKAPPSLIRYTCSHTTTATSMSRITIITFDNPAMATAMVATSGQTRHSFGPAQILLRRQQAAYDRICSAPAKIVMEILSREAPWLQKSFKPDWRRGLLINHASGEPRTLARWTIDPEHAKIRLEVAAEYKIAIERDMDKGINRLQFGVLEEEGERAGEGAGKEKGGWKGAGKGEGKGKGKGRKASGPGIPLDPAAFKRCAPLVRDQLGNMHFARFPFSISIRTLRLEQSEPRSNSVKRYTEPMDREDSKRRSPTPEATLQRQQAHQAAPLQGDLSQQMMKQELGPGIPDPWAVAAATATSAAASASSSTPAPGRQSEIQLGDRISA